MGDFALSAWQRPLLAVAITNALAVSVAAAATITVDSLTDNDTGCTLREAIVSANADDAAGNDCADGDGDDTIVFDAGLTLPDAITLTQGEMLISSSLSIQGPGADQLTINANNVSRHFYLRNNQANIIASISGLTLTAGYTVPFNFGGSIVNAEVLNLDRMVLSNNFATGSGGAIYSVNQLNINRSALFGNYGYGNGGAVASTDFQPSRIANTTLRSNSSSQRGGAIYSGGSNLTVVNSTISGNTAGNSNGDGSSGGGIATGFSGSPSRTITLLNSTLSDNSAREFVAPQQIDIRVGQARLVNTIVAGISAASGPACYGGNINASVNTLIEDGSCNPTLSGDPMLGSLVNNGGPTLTQTPLPGSPLIDAGSQTECDGASLVMDQTGRRRTLDGNDDGTATCDIGAYEFRGNFTFLDGFESP